MTQQRDDRPRGPSDATDYSSTQAPETQAAAEGGHAPTDERLQPGGSNGAENAGIGTLDRDTAVSSGEGSELSDIGSTGTEDKG